MKRTQYKLEQCLLPIFPDKGDRVRVKKGEGEYVKTFAGKVFLKKKGFVVIYCVGEGPVPAGKVKVQS